MRAGTSLIAAQWPGSAIDVLVNNAGVGQFAPLAEVTVADFDLTFAVNVRGPLLVIQSFAPTSQTVPASSTYRVP